MRRQGKVFLLVLAAVLVGSAATGIAVWRFNAPPTTRSPSLRPTSAATAPDRLITTNALYQAPVPSLCGHPAGTLVDGSLPGIPADQGYVNLLAKSEGMRSALVFGDLTGDGAIDAVAVFGCSRGGVNWPHQIVLYAPGPKILGAIDLGAVTSSEHADVEQMTIKSGDVLLEWKSYSGAGFCSKNWSARLHWDGQMVAVLNVVQTIAPSNGPSIPGAGC